MNTARIGCLDRGVLREPHRPKPSSRPGHARLAGRRKSGPDGASDQPVAPLRPDQTFTRRVTSALRDPYEADGGFPPARAIRRRLHSDAPGKSDPTPPVPGHAGTIANRRLCDVAHGIRLQTSGATAAASPRLGPPKTRAQFSEETTPRDPLFGPSQAALEYDRRSGLVMESGRAQPGARDLAQGRIEGRCWTAAGKAIVWIRKSRGASPRALNINEQMATTGWRDLDAARRAITLGVPRWNRFLTVTG